MNQLLRNIEIKVKQAMQQNQWAEAYKYCQEVLKVEPENRTFIKLRKKIEDEVNKINRKATLEDLKKIKVLFYEKKYQEYLNELLKLKVYTKDIEKLNEEIIKTQKAIAVLNENNLKKYFQEKMSKIKTLESSHSYAEALALYENLLSTRVQSEYVKKSLADMRKNWINYELSNQKELLASNNFEDILQFYNVLKSIDPENPMLKNLVENTREKYEKYTKQIKNDQFYQKLAKIRELYSKGKYDRALENIEVILLMNRNNKKALKLKEKIQRKLKHQIEQEVLDQLTKAYNKNKELYKSQQQKFVRF